MSKETPYRFGKSIIRLNLKKGRNNASSRSFLKSLTGLSDRENRCIIEDLRTEGIPVMSSSRHKGYWLPSTVSEVEEMISEYRHRAMMCNLMAGRFDLWLSEHVDELENI